MPTAFLTTTHPSDEELSRFESVNWSLQSLRICVNLWRDGESTRRIGLAIGRSRNTVIGKAHRMGLHLLMPPRHSRPAISTLVKPDKKPKPVKAAKALTPRLALVAPASPAPTVAKGLSHTERAFEGRRHAAARVASKGTAEAIRGLEKSDCRWPIGDPRSSKFRFCCEPSALGQPYCEEHCQAAFPNYGKPKPEPRYRRAA